MRIRLKELSLNEPDFTNPLSVSITNQEKGIQLAHLKKALNNLVFHCSMLVNLYAPVLELCNFLNRPNGDLQSRYSSLTLGNLSKVNDLKLLYERASCQLDVLERDNKNLKKFIRTK